MVDVPAILKAPTFCCVGICVFLVFTMLACISLSIPSSESPHVVCLSSRLVFSLLLSVWFSSSHQRAARHATCTI